MISIQSFQERERVRASVSSSPVTILERTPFNEKDMVNVRTLDIIYIFTYFVDYQTLISMAFHLVVHMIHHFPKLRVSFKY